MMGASARSQDGGCLGLYEKEGRAWVRGYQVPGAGGTRFRDGEIFNEPIQNLK